MSKPAPKPERSKLSPPQLARLWGGRPGKVLAWIRSGELRAIAADGMIRGRRWMAVEPDRCRLALIDTAGDRGTQAEAVERLRSARLPVLGSACVQGTRGTATASVLAAVQGDAGTILGRAEAAIGKPVRLAF